MNSDIHTIFNMNIYFRILSSVSNFWNMYIRTIICVIFYTYECFRIFIHVILFIWMYSHIHSCWIFFFNVTLWYNLISTFNVWLWVTHWLLNLVLSLKKLYSFFFFSFLLLFIHFYMQFLIYNLYNKKSITVCTHQLYGKGRFKYTRSLHHRLR